MSYSCPDVVEIRHKGGSEGLKVQAYRNLLGIHIFRSLSKRVEAMIEGANFNTGAVSTVPVLGRVCEDAISERKG